VITTRDSSKLRLWIETGEYEEQRLQHREEAEKFYRDLAAQGMKVRVGMEASGHARWQRIYERQQSAEGKPEKLAEISHRARA
jgi:hypothetical protein